MTDRFSIERGKYDHQPDGELPSLISFIIRGKRGAEKGHVCIDSKYAMRYLIKLGALLGRPQDHHYPRRDDEVATWLKRARDAERAEDDLGVIRSKAIDCLLDRYRECADYGLTLRPEDDHRGDP